MALVTDKIRLRALGDSSFLTQKIEYDGNLALYVGYAIPGTSSSTAGWAIKKLTYDGNLVTDIKWGGGDADFSQVWDDRVSLVYS